MAMPSPCTGLADPDIHHRERREQTLGVGDTDALAGGVVFHLVAG
jgi:hypothetical protein